MLTVSDDGVGFRSCSATSDCYARGGNTGLPVVSPFPSTTTTYTLHPIFFSAASNNEQIPTTNLTETFIGDFEFSTSHHVVRIQLEATSGPPSLIDYSLRLSNIVSTVSPISEPSTATLLGIGLIGPAIRRRLFATGHNAPYDSARFTPGHRSPIRVRGSFLGKGRSCDGGLGSERSSTGADRRLWEQWHHATRPPAEPA